MKKFFWYIMGLIFIKHWNLFVSIMSRFSWWYNFSWWIKATKDAPINHPIKLFISNIMMFELWECPHCKYEDWTGHEELFKVTGSGESHTPSGDNYWWEGDQECFRCGVISFYSDST
jgi:hypothetical protein